MVLWICCCTLTQPLTPYLLSFFLHSPSTPHHPFLPHLTPCSHTLSVCLCFLWSTQFDLSLGRSAQNLMDFLQSNLTSSLFIAVLYPVDLIFTRPHRLLHPHTKKISSSEFKMYCWLIKGVLIECSELGTPFTKCAHTHTHKCAYTQAHTITVTALGTPRTLRLGSFMPIKNGEKGECPSSKWNGISRSYHGLLQLSPALCCHVIQSKPCYLCVTAGECNTAQIASLTACIVLMRGGI